MKILISGASGFVASYLLPELKAAGHDIVLTAPNHREIMLDGEPHPCLPCDLTDPAAVSKMIEKARPEAIVHLGAISHVAKAEKERALLSSVNVVGTHNLCAAATNLLATTTFLYVSTALVYGGQDKGQKCSEATPPDPQGAYACSKLAAEYVVQSFKSDSFRSYCVRPFNHIGPGQSTDFVCTAFAKRIAEAAPGATIPVGNLDALRDFSDVRDIVRAYRLILEKQPKSHLFVLGSGAPVTIRSIHDYFVKISGKRLEIAVDSGLLRSNDQKVSSADFSLARELLGWTPEVPLQKSLSDIYASFQTGA